MDTLLDDDGAGNAGAVVVLHIATPEPETRAPVGLASGVAFLAAIDIR